MEDNRLMNQYLKLLDDKVELKKKLINIYEYTSKAIAELKIYSKELDPDKYEDNKELEYLDRMIKILKIIKKGSE